MLRESFTDTMKTLRDKDFQDLLVSYPRPPRTFFVAATVQDEVSSEWLIKGATGQEYKPADYLTAFEAFIRANADRVEAISILLSRPQGWGSQALRELREALLKTPEHFTEDNLRRAFQITHHKALVDVISMVKRAALDTSPLYTAEERVNQAIDRVIAGRPISEDQAKWVEYIRQHLVANLSIDREDFENVPVLLNRGGWGRANRVFDGELSDLLEDLNRELVAA
jgi:type I restriction enzyme, R subunit